MVLAPRRPAGDGSTVEIDLNLLHAWSVAQDHFRHVAIADGEMHGLFLGGSVRGRGRGRFGGIDGTTDLKFLGKLFGDLVKVRNGALHSWSAEGLGTRGRGLWVCVVGGEGGRAKKGRRRKRGGCHGVRDGEGCKEKRKEAR